MGTADAAAPGDETLQRAAACIVPNSCVWKCAAIVDPSTVTVCGRRPVQNTASSPWKQLHAQVQMQMQMQMQENPAVAHLRRLGVAARCRVGVAAAAAAAVASNAAPSLLRASGEACGLLRVSGLLREGTYGRLVGRWRLHACSSCHQNASTELSVSVHPCCLLMQPLTSARFLPVWKWLRHIREMRQLRDIGATDPAVCDAAANLAAWQRQ